MGGLYGIPTAYLLALWGSMYAARWSALNQDYLQTAAAFQFLRQLAVGYIALAVFLFGLCILCLMFSYRHAGTRAERNQVQWILLASLISLVLIAYLLAQAWIDPATLGRGNAAWPMFGVSLLYTMAYAFSITRYKLMQVEEIINRSAVYFAFSLTAGLIYSGVLLVSGKLIGDQLFSTHSTSRGAVAAALSVFVVLILSEVARGRFQRVIDRQFFREKYKFDRAMQKMRLAVGSLIDRVDAGAPAARGGVRGLAAGVGRALPGRRAGAAAATGGQPWPRARRAVARAGSSAGGPVAADARGPAFARAGAQRRVGPRHRRDDRAGRRGRDLAGRRRAVVRPSRPRPQAERHALRRRRDGVPGGT